MLYLNPTLTLTPTPTLSLLLTLHLTLPVTLTLIKTEYWDRVGGVVPILLYVRTTVFPSPLFALATGFRFTAIPLLHECH